MKSERKNTESTEILRSRRGRQRRRKEEKQRQKQKCWDGSGRKRETMNKNSLCHCTPNLLKLQARFHCVAGHLLVIKYSLATTILAVTHHPIGIGGENFTLSVRRQFHIGVLHDKFLTLICPSSSPSHEKNSRLKS